MFNLIEGWLSDSESPVVPEINLDAVEKNGNQFLSEGLTQDGEWTRCPADDGGGFMRYRVLEVKGNHDKAEYQENGGGSLTAALIMEFSVEKREIWREGKPVSLRVLRVLSVRSK